ncbi:MAG: hypothetical protein U9N14_05825, partial [Pseudomonadota bacterium]|nr:hypothetical protein [Pseudomonadota bacterium]
LLGTAGGLFALQASSLNEAITPANVTVRRQTTAAAADRLPVKIGRATLFVQRMGKKLLAADYALDRDAYAAEDMSLLAHHLLREGIAAIVHQAEPHGIVWSVTEGGELLGLTYLAAQDVIAWHRHPLGGTDVAVLSVAAIPTEGQDELWLVVERSIDGQTVRTVERLTAPIAPVDENDKDDLFFVDCGLSYTGVPATEISGLDHLEGETVSILADGAAHPDRVVTDGAVTLMRSASSVHVGLGYTSRLTTLDLNAGSAAGTALGKPTRVHAVTVRFLETLGAHAGFDADHLDPVLFRTGASSMDASPPLYTGFKRIAFPKGWDRAARVHVTQNQPLPCTITAIVPHVTTNEG